MPSFYAKEVLRNPQNVHCLGSPMIDKTVLWLMSVLNLHYPNFCLSMKNWKISDFDEDGDPTVKGCLQASGDFGQYYKTKEVNALYRAVYDNINGLQDKYVAYVAKVAQRLSSNQYVMGFDVLNEPGPVQDNVMDGLEMQL